MCSLYTVKLMMFTVHLGILEIRQEQIRHTVHVQANVVWQPFPKKVYYYIIYIFNLWGTSQTSHYSELAGQWVRMSVVKTASVCDCQQWWDDICCCSSPNLKDIPLSLSHQAVWRRIIRVHAFESLPSKSIFSQIYYFIQNCHLSPLPGFVKNKTTRSQYGPTTTVFAVVDTIIWCLNLINVI
jgi:hypothetical protein